ncbi:hypothetical protein J4476_06015 [Candidatus Woesearchaeota archaeon]|nr:hypothetical protein [Candidatus Woesearchaeota archaeon]HIH25551.1 hypothetical protein [Nanoarchaeota archaeon]
MLNQLLIDAIKNNLQKGYSTEQIRQGLINKGWPSNDVDEAIQSAKNDMGQNTEEHPKITNIDNTQQKPKHHGPLYVLLIILLVVIILVGLYIFYAFYVQPIFNSESTLTQATL